MNANLAEVCPADESLLRRERLLATAATASRALLEAPDVIAAVPQVLREFGEAATLDRVNLLLPQHGPGGERLLVVAAEWVAPGIVPHLGHSTMGVYDEREFARECAELRSGRSVCMLSQPDRDVPQCRFSGLGTKTKAIIPLFIDGEFSGVVGFDSTRQLRSIESTELSALEMAAGIIGAALHRERLVDAVRRERARAAEEQVAELARANAAIRGTLERLASVPDLASFLQYVLLEATRQVNAAGGSVVLWKEALDEWRIAAFVKDGEIAEPDFPTVLRASEARFDRRLRALREPIYLDYAVPEDAEMVWPGTLDGHGPQPIRRMFALPLVFGERTIGCIGLTFRHRDPIGEAARELLIALGSQVTLALELTRLAYVGKKAAVLEERNRIGQEIHDGLAQAFTGILMQLGAAEELQESDSRKKLSLVLNRIRDLAKEGLTEARRSVLALRPEETRRGSLTIALAQLAERSSVLGRVVCTFEGGAIETGLPPEHEHALLRIAQEAVSNAVRHANPQHVKILLAEHEADLEFSVSDDGIGMDDCEECGKTMGFGLENMQERAKSIGGRWTIETAPAKPPGSSCGCRSGGGTRVSRVTRSPRMTCTGHS